MKIAIDLGHGVGPDRGASGFINEEEIINSVGTKVISKLRALGHTVIEVRPSSASTVSNSLIRRTTTANNNSVDMFVSIHANAGGGKGSEVFTYGGKHSKEAVAVLNNIVSLGFVNRGIKDGANLSVVKRSYAPAMLIEVCFVDTASDVNLYKTIGSEVIASEIVAGLTGTSISVEKGEWELSEKGWKYKLNDEYIKDSWKKIKGEWYLFDKEGIMLYGWQFSSGNNWYYLGSDDNDGQAKKGWQLIGGNWYYFDEENCNMRTGWVKIDNRWFYFDNDGKMQTGWIKDDGKDYLLYTNGEMAHDCELYGYRFDSHGVATKID